MELEAGETKSISMTIDLTKGYRQGERNKKHLIKAVCYDKDRNEIDEVTLFEQWSRKSFEVLDVPKVLEWTYWMPMDGFALPVRRFTDLEKSISLKVDGISQNRTSGLDNVRVFFRRPTNIFDTQTIELSQWSNSVLTSYNYRVSITRNPVLLDLNIGRTNTHVFFRFPDRELDTQFRFVRRSELGEIVCSADPLNAFQLLSQVNWNLDLDTSQSDAAYCELRFIRDGLNETLIVPFPLPVNGKN